MFAVLIDTNVLVYLHDRNEAAKQQIAVDVFDYLQPIERACLSAQTLAEFFNATTKGALPMLSAAQAATQVSKLAGAFTVLEITAQIVLEATRGVREHQLAYWDAQLWATARLNQIPIIFSEDFNSGASLEGVRFVNPFAPGFAVDEWA